MYKEGETLECVKVEPMPGNTIHPPLELGKQYPAKGVHECDCGLEHIDVGLKSEYEYVSCYNCKKILPHSDIIHWCHPSRFVLILKP